MSFRAEQIALAAVLSSSKVMMATTLECVGDCRASGPAQKLGVERCRLCIPRHLVLMGKKWGRESLHNCTSGLMECM